jgi:signal transduction histidine kinase
MTQVFMNILRNAIQSIEAEGCIEVSSQPGQNETIEVTIRDNGKGIAPSEITKVFDPFYTTKPVGEGVGLGLSTAYGIVADLQGEITISSELGEGTVVKVILPAATTEQD